MSEFTGERVIPELVNADLLNEHLSRYRFARHFAAGLPAMTAILDAGCGAGYGSAQLCGAANFVWGTDIAPDAVRHANAAYAGEDVGFLPAACEALPFRDGAFDLVVAFEVIEHLDRWEAMLTEVHRVLKPGGVLLVSTPNRDYYAESRGTAGPNPFHRHEFSYAEFQMALAEVFPHVCLWTQNHAEAIVFAPSEPAGAVLDAGTGSDASEAHFYLAACSRAPIADRRIFAWAPSSANLLRERERHIAKLSGELEQKDIWLGQALEAHSELQRNHETLTAELERQNHWAEELNREIGVRNNRIAELQAEVEARLGWVRDVEARVVDKDEQLEGARVEIERLNGAYDELTRVARTEIARLRAESEGAQAQQAARIAQLDAELESYLAEFRRIRGSKWVRAGRKLGLGPEVRDRR